MAFGINNITNLDQPVGRSEPSDQAAERAAARRSEEEARGEEERSRVRGEQTEQNERSDDSPSVGGRVNLYS